MVTGAAGFIGYHVIGKLLDRGDLVLGIDNLNNYYDPLLKQTRLDNLFTHEKSTNFEFIKLDIADREGMANLFRDHKPEYVIHLAAQAGVRYSLDNPHSYVESNLVGFVNVLEGCRSVKVQHLVFASSSSVYGMNSNQPFNTNDRVDSPVSLYAATKKSNELMAFSYNIYIRFQLLAKIFYSVWPLWPTRHGLLQIHKSYLGGAGDRCLQFWRDDERFHIHR
jgi:UDP-glucuronate 4-epimerase